MLIAHKIFGVFPYSWQMGFVHCDWMESFTSYYFIGFFRFCTKHMENSNTTSSSYLILSERTSIFPVFFIFFSLSHFFTFAHIRDKSHTNIHDYYSSFTHLINGSCIIFLGEQQQQHTLTSRAAHEHTLTLTHSRHDM